VGDLLQRALSVDTLVVAVDPGKAQNRVWLSTDTEGLVLDPVTLPVLRPGLDELARLISLHRGSRVPVIAVEATGALHQAWVGELHRRFPWISASFRAVRDSRRARSARLSTLQDR